MKTLNYILAMACIVSCLAFVSCDKEEQNQYGDGSIYLPMSDLTIHPLGDEVYVSFTSSSPWKVKQSEPWLALSKSSGEAGVTSLKITVVPFIPSGNTDTPGQKRESKIVFSNADREQTFTVTQEAAYISIVDEAGKVVSDIKFDWKGEDDKYTKTYTIKSNVMWKMTPSSSKDFDFKLDDNDIENKLYNGDVKLTIKPNYYNYNKESNEAILSISPYKTDVEGNITSKEGDYASLSHKFNVIQDYLILVVSEDDPNTSWSKIEPVEKIEGFSELGDTKTFYVYYEEGMTLDVSSEKSDADFTVTNVGLSTTPIDANERKVMWARYDAKFKKPNPDFDNPRTTEYIISPSGTDIPKEAEKPLTFVQNRYKFDFSGGLNVDIANEGETKEFTLDTEGDWMVEYGNDQDWLNVLMWNDNDWVKLEPNTTYEGITEIRVEVENRNLSFYKDNVLTLKFKPTTITNVKNLTIKQPKFEFDVTIDGANEKIAVSSHTKKSYEMTVKSSGSWTVENVADWIVIDDVDDEQSGNQTKSVTFNVNSGKKREQTIKIISLEHQSAGGYWEDEYTKMFTITQNEMRANILDAQGGSVMTDREVVAYGNGTDKSITSTFFLECSAPWTLKSKPDWLKLLYDGSEMIVGNRDESGEYYEVTLNVDKNIGTDKRDGSVVFDVDTDANGSYDKQIEFEVHQDGFVFNVTTKSTYSYEAINTSSDEIVAEITNGAEPSYEFADWVNGQLTNTSVGEKTTTYTFTICPTHNIEELNKQRNSNNTIGIKSEKNLYKTVPVTQKPFEFVLDQTSLSSFKETKGSSQTITVKKCSGSGSTKYYNVKYPSWLEAQEVSDLWTFTTSSVNTSTTEKRAGEIKFVLKHPDISANETYVLMSVPVQQNTYTWSVEINKTKTPFAPIYKDSDDYEGIITIKSSGKWTAASSDDDIVELATDSGSGVRNGEELAFEVQPNYTEKAVSAKITVTNKDLNDTKTFTINQSAYVFTVDSSITVDDAKGDDELSVVCSGDWDVDDISEKWLDAEADTKNGKLEIEFDANTTGKERKATIKIKTSDKSKITREITVIQQA